MTTKKQRFVCMVCGKPVGPHPEAIHFASSVFGCEHYGVVNWQHLPNGGWITLSPCANEYGENGVYILPKEV